RRLVPLGRAEGARPALRREPAPGGVALRGLPEGRRAAARQGALLQQCGRHRRRARPRRGVPGAAGSGRRHPHAQHAVRRRPRAPAVRGVVRGVLVQDQDRAIEDPREARVVTRRRPTPEELLALAFAWRVVKHVKSNAIAFTTADRTLALGGGQTSRVEPVRNARARAERLGISLSGSVVGSDAFFPFPDGLEEALEAGATAVIQPGGST